jgi:hypothetical protein
LSKTRFVTEQQQATTCQEPGDNTAGVFTKTTAVMFTESTAGMFTKSTAGMFTQNTAVK